MNELYLPAVGEDPVDLDGDVFTPEAAKQLIRDSNLYLKSLKQSIVNGVFIGQPPPTEIPLEPFWPSPVGWSIGGQIICSIPRYKHKRAATILQLLLGLRFIHRMTYTRRVVERMLERLKVGTNITEFKPNEVYVQPKVKL